MKGNGLLTTVEKGLPRGLVTREQPALSDSTPGGDQGLWKGTYLGLAKSGSLG